MKTIILILIGVLFIMALPSILAEKEIHLHTDRIERYNAHIWHRVEYCETLSDSTDVIVINGEHKEATGVIE